MLSCRAGCSGMSGCRGCWGGSAVGLLSALTITGCALSTMRNPGADNAFTASRALPLSLMSSAPRGPNGAPLRQGSSIHHRPRPLHYQNNHPKMPTISTTDTFKIHRADFSLALLNITRKSSAALKRFLGRSLR